MENSVFAFKLNAFLPIRLFNVLYKSTSAFHRYVFFLITKNFFRILSRQFVSTKCIFCEPVNMFSKYKSHPTGNDDMWLFIPFQRLQARFLLLPILTFYFSKLPRSVSFTCKLRKTNWCQLIKLRVSIDTNNKH